MESSSSCLGYSNGNPRSKCPTLEDGGTLYVALPPRAFFKAAVGCRWQEVERVNLSHHRRRVLLVWCIVGLGVICGLMDLRRALALSGVMVVSMAGLIRSV
jgi:hypothetical protein